MRPNALPARATYDVCPTCKRPLAVVFATDCDGHSFPSVWTCHEHGAVTPMRSAVVNHYPEPDWSAA